MIEKKTTLQDQIKEALALSEAKPDWSFSRLMAAMCQIRLQNYEAAQENCLVALTNCTYGKEEPGYRAFIGTSEIEKLPELYILAGQPDAFWPQLVMEVDAFRQDPRGNSLAAHYAYALLDFLVGEDAKALLHYAPLTKYPKVKEMFAIGEVVAAIAQRNQQSFDDALKHLLIAHRGMAKFGGLRETPLGYLCLSAMCLAKLARERGLTINAESEYFSQAYLAFLDQHEGLLDWPISRERGIGKRSLIWLYNWCAECARMIARIPAALLQK